jgi:hypothetical protein
VTLLLGIYREPEYSPAQHTSNDAIILQLVGRALEQEAAAVELAALPVARTRWRDAALVFSMCQGPDALAELAHWAQAGARIVNDPLASRRTYRDQLCPLRGLDGVPFPPSMFVRTDRPLDRSAASHLFRNGAAWAKRPDVHATCAADVIRLDGWGAADAALEGFRRRGIAEIVVQEHRPGDEIKFYGVADSEFFWYFYPWEFVGYPFDPRALRRLAEQAAGLAGVGIFGGDAIVAPDGSLTIIDLNDWPSFAPCRGAAAGSIARHILRQVGTPISRGPRRGPPGLREAS